jgi:hypothetical protein
MKNTKYIVYKISGGLNHMLGQINNAIHFSILSKRHLIIDCFAGAFQNDFNKFFNIPGFKYSTNYESLYNDSSIEESFEPYINANAKYTDKGYFLNEKK